LRVPLRDIVNYIETKKPRKQRKPRGLSQYPGKTNRV